MRTTPWAMALAILHVTLCSSQPESNFLMYDKNVNKCLKGYQPLKLFYCDSNQLSQKFRWTSNDRILNVHMSKCLGAGSKADGSGLQWYICDETSELQKWVCKNDTLLNLKGTNLFLSQDENTILKLTQDIGAASQWLIHGTTEGLCSQPYQELYTIGGTAYGSPCHFPFKYQGKWYSDCTPGDTSELICVTDRDYPNKWGFCPTKSTKDWKKNPVTGVFYQVNENSALTWHQARRSCQQQDSDLLSITEPQEQTYISGITSGIQTIFWIGLNQLDTESGWQLTDGSPFRYLRWDVGQPSREQGWSCAALNTIGTNSWENRLCSKKHAYICEKSTTIPAVTPGPPVSCSAPWIPYAGHCYFLNRTKNTWKDSNTQCLNAGGHLLSIHDIEEQSFVRSQLGYMETDKLWIGLNDQKTQLLFEWSDQSAVTFTTWDTEEPSHHRSIEEDCVLMGGKDAKWADANCGENNGFICKRAGDSQSSSGSEAGNTGCKAGWVRYGYNCYFVGSTTKTFEEAKKSCQDSGAHLVDIPNRVENAFLISLVGARPEKHFWIGLSNQRDRYTFEWSNSQDVPYTHWNTRMPGQKQGCVAMTTGTLAGLWDVLSCSSKEKYICKHQAEGVVTTPAPPTSPAPSCAEGWKPLGVRHFCYKLYSVERTWFEALAFCRSIGGDLISIHSQLDEPERRYEDYRQRDAWIGYSAPDPNAGYTWSDGSSSSFTNWQEGEPNNVNNMENCAGIYFRSKKWNDFPCETKRQLFCEIRKGMTPLESNVTVPRYNVTKDGWIEFNDHQYYIEKRQTEQMEDAQKICKRGHGDLAVIDSEAERVFLWQQIQKAHVEKFYIGLKIDLDQNTEWMDGTAVGFQRWNEDQPNFVSNDETCVKMGQSFGLWSVTNCGQALGFICERHETPPVNATLAAPTEAPKGGCAPDWTKYREYCYKAQSEKKSWTEARSYCKVVGGNLVSITRRDEQAFLTTMVADAPHDLWIGLHTLSNHWRPLWTEGKKLSYENFLNGYASFRYRHMRYRHMIPHLSWGSTGECTAIITKPRTSFGKWQKYECSEKMGFICRRPTDKQITPQTTVLPQSYIKFGNDTFKVELTNLTWWEAKKRCEADGAQLASIRDSITQAYIELQIHKLKQPMWIGLNKNMTGGYFKWIDNWPLNMENWGFSRPGSQFSCVYMSSYGTWVPEQCNQSLPSVCKRSTEIAPTPDSRFPGQCFDNWMPFQGHCYFFSNREIDWPDASTDCVLKGASLLSIEDTKEAEFINGKLEMEQDTYSAYWIGLYKNLKGQWHWLDKTVLDYTNWADRRPASENHAAISTSDFKWKHRHMRMDFPYICKKPKEPLTVEPTEIPVLEVNRLYTGMIVVVVITLVIVIGFAVFVVYGHYKRTDLATIPAFENPLYTKEIDLRSS
ncbi:macrophage mannose receptor 1-like [Sardina pilchardus]|uniref:macrophage mannose receptor 1-like n=1 Tax=Sardina pilchardus TaxID=27697 RepID=UPI002E0D89B9